MTLELKIEKRIPIPKPTPKGGGKPSGEFRKMNVGDSALLPGIRKNAGSIPTQWGRATGWKFTQRQIMVNGKTRVRIWRVE